MGSLRTILAIAVVVYHSFMIFGLRLCGGQIAVESFYMISGFYMALILNEKYVGPGHYFKFIKSRFVRIFPVYWVILITAVLVSVIGYYAFGKPYYLSRYITNHGCLSGLTIFYFILENVMVIGQELMYFMRINELCSPEFVYNVFSYKQGAYQYLFVPQAWSISIEFLFYLIAPFLVTKKVKWQLVLVVLGLGIKFYYAYWEYLRFDPWTYRFFPFELAFFLIGSLGYRYYKYLETKPVSNRVGYVLLSLCFIGVFSIHEMPLPDKLKPVLFYIMVACSIPYIFSAFKNNKTDRYIGELSFTIYISHHLVVSILRGYFFSHPHLMVYYGYLTVTVSILLALILQYVLVKPIERYRAKIFS